MEKKVIVRANKGSLKQAVKIAFTITPHEPNGPSYPYYPIAISVKAFAANGAESCSVRWAPYVNLNMYTIEDNAIKATGIHATPAPGEAVALMSPTAWGRPAPHNLGTLLGVSSRLVTNESGSRQNILLGSSWRQIAYHPLENGSTIIVPASWELQAYVVNNDINNFRILQTEDLRRPLFANPVLWDKLPTESTWTFSQDNVGVYQITNGGLDAPKIATQPEGTNGLLFQVLGRLARMEKTIERLQEDYTTGQNTVDGIQAQLRALERTTGMTGQEVLESRGKINAIETKTTTLAGSFGESQTRLAVMQGAVAETQQLLSGLEKSTLDRFSTMEESTSRIKDHLVTVEKAVHQTQDHVSTVQQLVLAKQTPSAGISTPTSPLPVHPQHPGGQNPAVEPRVEKLERSALEQRRAVRAMEHRIPDVEAIVDKLETDLGALDRRVAIVEARSEYHEARMGGSPPHLAGCSPQVFPSHLPDTPPATRSALAPT